MMHVPEVSGPFDRDILSENPTVPDDILSKLEPVTLEDMVWYRPKEEKTTDRIRTMCEAMLAYNTVPTTADVPEDMVGVFWMDGNKVPEELACLSYSSFSTLDGYSVCTRVNSAMSWSYLDTDTGRSIASFQESPTSSGMMAFIFDRELREGHIHTCETFDYADLNWLTRIGGFTMERLDCPGVDYKRGCYWFEHVFGKRLEFGSYTLRKIMNTDRTPVQPAYDEFVRYMDTTQGGANMIMPAPPEVQPAGN